MAFSIQLNERLNVLGTIQSASATNTYLSDAIDLGKARRVLALVNVGTIGVNATVDFNFQWATTSGGSYTDLTTGYKITQDTTGGNTHLVEFAVEQLKSAQPTARFVKGKLVIGTNATAVGVTILGGDADFMPVTNPASKVGQIVTSKAG